MEKLHFTASINAPKTKVWEVLWGDETYGQWTRPFAEGSAAITDWKEGSRVLFTAGNGDGMVSMIEKKVDNSFMSFKHIGMIKDGKEDTESDAVNSFAGAHENYKLEEKDGVTMLNVEMDTVEDYKKYFQDTWPLAIDKLKALAENS